MAIRHFASVVAGLAMARKRLLAGNFSLRQFAAAILFLTGLPSLAIGSAGSLPGSPVAAGSFEAAGVSGTQNQSNSNSLAVSDIVGTWSATSTDSISSGTSYLKLSEDGEGALVGTLEIQGITVGKVAARFDGSTLFFTLTQDWAGCPGSFSGKARIEGSSGTGSYVGTDCQGEHQNGVMSLVRLSSSTSAATPQTEKPKGTECIVGHPDPNYVTWVCDHEFRPSTTKTEIFYIRTSLAGEQVATSIWEGSRGDWTAHSSKIIANHKAGVGRCSAFVNIVQMTEAGQAQWDWVSQNMLEWIKKEGSKNFRNLCLAKNPWEADFVIMWSSVEGGIPYSYTIPVPQIAYYSGFQQGRMNFYSGADIGFGNYSGTSTGTVTTFQNQTVTGEWPTLTVNAAVYPVKADTRAIYQSTHVGRWRWSKPDEDVLEDCFEFLGRRLPNR